ncbi:hypothetical protein [Paraburkholderia terrae]|uniref:hypothetical protein n=1 Tax=Paraburkholderia terrae TaxID=311230 RepID=UPI0012DFF7CB|nr:hypothetical protein [Paraburkholderia terrae]
MPDNATLASGGKNNRLPIPETVTADNGLQVESNPKHTPGMPGNRPNADTEPSGSLDLFNSSIPGGEKTRCAIDSEGNINRFYSDRNGVYQVFQIWNAAAPNEYLTAIVSVVCPTREGTKGYYDPVKNIRVVTNSKTGLVVTVIPGAPGK